MAIDFPWTAPLLSTGEPCAAACYREGVAALVAGGAHADALLARAIDLDPGFVLARVAFAVVGVTAGRSYERPGGSLAPTRAERQHVEVVNTAFAGDRRRALDLRREHLVDFPGDLLIVWLPAVLNAQPHGGRDH
jgi:hypothetical protein